MLDCLGTIRPAKEEPFAVGVQRGLCFVHHAESEALSEVIEALAADKLRNSGGRVQFLLLAPFCPPDDQGRRAIRDARAPPFFIGCRKCHYSHAPAPSPEPVAGHAAGARQPPTGARTAHTDEA